MAISPPLDHASALPEAAPHRGFLTQAGEFCRTQPLGAIGAGIILPCWWWAPSRRSWRPTIRWPTPSGSMLSPPSMQHWLGTDAFGRDVLSRLIYGSRTALLVGFGASVLGATLGAVISVASAYFGGRIDLYTQRVMDIFLSFPLIVLALALVAILGNSLPNLITAIMIPMIPRCALVIRASALAIREMPYVDAARPPGSGTRGSSCATCCPTSWPPTSSC